MTVLVYKRWVPVIRPAKYPGEVHRLCNRTRRHKIAELAVLEEQSVGPGRGPAVAPDSKSRLGHRVVGECNLYTTGFDIKANWIAQQVAALYVGARRPLSKSFPGVWRTRQRTLQSILQQGS